MSIPDYLKPTRIFGASNIAYAVRQSMKNASKTKARSKYMPHQGKKEIARRLRKAAQTA